MRLLDRYLLRELLVPLGYCLGGFTILWLSADLLNELDRFQERGQSAAEIAAYYFWSLPELFNLLLPVALLLAVLYALTNHSRHNELTAIRAAGVGLWRLSAPYLGLGIATSLALTTSNERLLPVAEDRLETLSGRGPAARDTHANLVFKNTRDNRVWSAQSFNLRSGELLRPFILWTLPDGGRHEIYAQGGLHTNGVWVFVGVQEVRYAADDPIPLSNSLTNRLIVSGWSETPDRIRLEIKINALSSVKAAKGAQLTLDDIRAYLRDNPETPPATGRILRTQFHARLAEPWRCLVVVLVAVPFGAAGGRRSKFVGVAASIFIVFAYMIVFRVGLALGTGGYLDPLLGAWLPNMLFAAGGAFLISRAR